MTYVPKSTKLILQAKHDEDMASTVIPTTPGTIPRDVNGTDNFRSESASASVFEDMVCNYVNPPDMDADTDFDQSDIRRIL